MFNPELYLVAYGRIYSNKGAMTPGTTAETADGMSLGKIHKIIELMRYERYRFSPVKRAMIPKKNGKLRPLGLPGWSDKLVGEVMRLLLEAYYEPRFSDRSHGFRPERGCHTALREVANTWTGTAWLIEGDISDCFGSLDHEVMLSILAEKIHDNRFLRLLKHADGRIPGGLGMECHTLRSTARRCSFPFALQYLPAPARYVCRASAHTGIQPRGRAGQESRLP